MRQPTFFAHAWPRFDHQVYCLGRGSTRRNTSTQPSLSNTSLSQARSSGRNPEFLRFPRQFSRSISLCAMFQSPQRTNSRPLALSSFSVGMNSSRKRNFACCLSSGLDPRVQRDAAVAFFRRATIVVGAVPLGNEREGREVRFLRLYFLQTYDVCALTSEPAWKPLCERRADAVE